MNSFRPYLVDHSIFLSALSWARPNEQVSDAVSYAVGPNNHPHSRGTILKFRKNRLISSGHLYASMSRVGEHIEQELCWICKLELRGEF